MKLEKVDIENISSVEEDDNILLMDTESQCLAIPFFETSDIYGSKNDFEKFIKSVERIVRKSRSYKEYIYELKTTYKLDQCAVLGKVKDSMAKIEMHHGPIFTLYDYAEILMAYLLDTNNGLVNEFDLAKLIMLEHFEHNVQVVMLCTSVHKSIHTKTKTGERLETDKIPMDRVWGDIFTFVNKYKLYFQTKHIDKINDYLNKNETDKVFISQIEKTIDKLM